MTVFEGVLRNAGRRNPIYCHGYRAKPSGRAAIGSHPKHPAMKASPAAAPSPNVARFAIHVAIVLTIVMVLFPPFTSLNGTEYAFLLTGPEWARLTGALGEDLGLTARIHWVLLLVQLAAVWAIALGAKQFLGRPPAM